jgi:5'-nucleotidase (lipoprotein e(P4) family)
MRGLLLGAAALTLGITPAWAQAPAPAKKPVVIETEQALGIRYLYGSAEAASLSRQTYRALTAYALDKVNHRPTDAVVLAPNATVEAPGFDGCGRKKDLAVIFDADETLIWNIGGTRWLGEHGMTFDAKVWSWWEATGAQKILPVPGAVEAVNALKKAGIAVIVISNRDAASTDVPTGADHWKATAAALKAAGFGEFTQGENMFLRGTGPDRSNKDDRRRIVSEKYCVIAMAGDQLGDFSQLFNAEGLSPKDRQARAALPAFDALWGNGWFLLPNPLYGPWDKAKLEDIFDDAQKW